MATLRLVISAALVLAALYVTVMNGACAYLSRRNRRQGIAKHHSTIPLVVEILLILAALLSPEIPRLPLAIMALADVSLWQLAYLPILLLRRRQQCA